MRNILFQKIPIDENGKHLLSWDEVSKVHNMILNQIPVDHILITSPMNLSIIEGDTKIIKIDCREYSALELLEIIEKASMYDGLCN